MYTKRIQLNRCIIHHENLVELASFFETMRAREGGFCTIHAYFRDGSSVLNSCSQFMNEEYFKRKDLARIHFNFTGKDKRKIVSLYLEECVFFASDSNEFEIFSDSERWLNDIEVKFNELVARFPKNSPFRMAFALPWVPGTFLLLCIAFWELMRLCGFSYGSRPMLSNGQMNSEAIFIPLSWAFIAIALVFALIAAIVCILYPAQEFAFGLTRHPRRIKIRKALNWPSHLFLFRCCLPCCNSESPCAAGGIIDRLTP